MCSCWFQERPVVPVLFRPARDAAFSGTPTQRAERAPPSPLLSPVCRVYDTAMSVLQDALKELADSKPFQRQVGRILSHPLTLLAVATICATVAGVWLTNYYQEQTWIRDKQFEVYKHRLDEGLLLVDDLSEAMGRRLFGLHRVLWVAKGTGTGELDAVWNEYYESVVDWNVHLARDRSRLSRLIGAEAAEAFSSPQDAALSYAEGVPMSIHGQFFVAHQRARALVDCVRDRCPVTDRQAALAAAQQDVAALGEAVDQFLEACTGALLSSGA